MKGRGCQARREHRGFSPCRSPAGHDSSNLSKPTEPCTTRREPQISRLITTQKHWSISSNKDTPCGGPRDAALPPPPLHAHTCAVGSGAGVWGRCYRHPPSQPHSLYGLRPRAPSVSQRAGQCWGLSRPVSATRAMRLQEGAQAWGDLSTQRHVYSSYKSGHWTERAPA